MSKQVHPHSRALLALFVFGLAGQARAEETAIPSTSTETTTIDSGTESRVASALYENGLSLFARGRFEEAIAEFRKAYELQARADFLLHIGRSFDKLGQTQKALYFFKRYLLTAPPEADSRVEAQAYVSRHDAPPTEPSTPAVVATNDLVPVTESSSLWRQWWFWTAVGVVVVAGVTLGVTLASNAGDAKPTSELGHMRF